MKLGDPLHLGRLEHPKLALEYLRGLVVIDEIQWRPDLFPVLRRLADRPKKTAHLLILGSASGDLIRPLSDGEGEGRGVGGCHQLILGNGITRNE